MDNRISRRSFLTKMAGGAGALMLTGCNGINLSNRKKQQPNVIILLADDMGYADPSCFGGTGVKTPNLDRLARSGVKLENFYAASAVCTPTRAAILTGKYPLRFDIHKHFSDDGAHLARKATTLPELLKKVGYATAHLGKWHLGGLRLEDIADRANSSPGPHEHGFDYYQCQIEGNPPRGQMFRERILYRQGGECLLRNDKRVGPDDPYYYQHYTDINGHESVRLVKEFHETGKPFFLNCFPSAEVAQVGCLS